MEVMKVSIIIAIIVLLVIAAFFVFYSTNNYLRNIIYNNNSLNNSPTQLNGGGHGKYYLSREEMQGLSGSNGTYAVFVTNKTFNPKIWTIHYVISKSTDITETIIEMNSTSAAEREYEMWIKNSLYSNQPSASIAGMNYTWGYYVNQHIVISTWIIGIKNNAVVDFSINNFTQTNQTFKINITKTAKVMAGDLP